MTRMIVATMLIGMMTCSCGYAETSELPADEQNSSTVVLGYIPGWNEIPYDELPWDRMTHAAHAFMGCDEEGGLVPHEPTVPDPLLAEAAHKHGVKLILSIGGAASDTYLDPMARNPESLERFIKGVVQAVEVNNYDGIDLDWEHPETDQANQGFVKLLKGLRAALDELSNKHEGRPYLLTAAVNGWRFGVDGDVFAEYCDFVNVMTYDIAGPWSDYLGHGARLTASDSDISNGSGLSVETAMEFWSKDKGVPREKLLVGLPFYARGFRGLEPYTVVDEKNPELHSIYLYSEIAPRLQQGWTRHWNVENQVPWMSSPSGDEWVGYDDPQSIEVKTRWAREQGYGVIIWAIGQDRLQDGSYPLMDAISAGLEEE